MIKKYQEFVFASCMGFCICLDFIVVDQPAHHLMKAAADCRRLLGGPFNPQFDVCKVIRDTLTDVSYTSLALFPVIRQ